MFDHKHYVPIIKSKAGELWALRHLSESARKVTTPLLEILDHNSHAIPVHAANLFETLVGAWGTESPLFVDTHYLGIETQPEARAFSDCFAAARRQGVKAIPVTSLGRSQAYQQAVLQVIQADQRGVAIRLEVPDFVDPDTLIDALSRLLSLFGVRPRQVDIIIDYGARIQESEIVQLTRFHLGDLPQITHWRTLTVAAGSFPASLIDLTQNNWHQVLRNEWRAWITTLTRKKPLERFPAFGDYGVRDPAAPAAFGRPSANLRYCSNDYWIVRRGRLVRDDGAADMPGICRSLMTRPEWCTEPFSAGDAQIARIAASQDSTGNAGQWVSWCMNHHFEFVADQIQNHPDL